MTTFTIAGPVACSFCCCSWARWPRVRIVDGVAMPFKSKAQQKFMFARHPKLAKEMANAMTKAQFKRLPARKKKRKK